MKKIKKKTANILMKLIIILFTLSNLHVSAQRTALELSVYGGGGISFFICNPMLPNAFSIGYHGDLGVGLTVFASPQIGFHVGAGFGLNNTKLRVDNLKNLTSGLIDANAYPFDLHTTLIGYNEIHKTVFVSFPVMFQFQAKEKKQAWDWTKSQKKRFYLKAGGKALLLLDHKYEVGVNKLNNLAYYPEFDNWAGTQTFAGLGDFDGNSNNGKLGLSIVAMATVEAGIKWRIGEKVYLYSGAYFDVGLMDPTKISRSPIRNYTYAEHLQYLTLLQVADRVNLMGVGVRVRLAFAQPPKKEPCPQWGNSNDNNKYKRNRNKN